MGIEELQLQYYTELGKLIGIVQTLDDKRYKVEYDEIKLMEWIEKLKAANEVFGL